MPPSETTPHPWGRALRDADQPPDLTAAVAFELECLWNDLSHTRRLACNGSWSIGCDNIATRIIMLTRMTQATPWDRVPVTLVADGTYQGILESAGIAFEPPDMAAVRRLYAQVRTGSVPLKGSSA